MCGVQAGMDAVGQKAVGFVCSFVVLKARVTSIPFRSLRVVRSVFLVVRWLVCDVLV